MLIILLPNLHRAMALETTNHNLISMLEVKFQHNSDAVKCCRRLKRNKTFRSHSIPKITTETAEKKQQQQQQFSVLNKHQHLVFIDINTHTLTHIQCIRTRFERRVCVRAHTHHHTKHTHIFFQMQATPNDLLDCRQNMQHPKRFKQIKFEFILLFCKRDNICTVCLFYFIYASLSDAINMCQQ